MESTLEGDVDLQGFLGIGERVGNGYKKIRVKLKGDVPEAILRDLVQVAQAHSPCATAPGHHGEYWYSMQDRRDPR